MLNKVKLPVKGNVHRQNVYTAKWGWWPGRWPVMTGGKLGWKPENHAALSVSQRKRAGVNSFRKDQLSFFFTNSVNFL